MISDFQTAVVHSVSSKGLSLIFPNSDEPSQKLYNFNKSVSFKVGQRVLLIPSENTFVAAFPLNS